ncbi:bifunctional DNA primase/polymerase [Streptomyces sp. DSM 42041]|uniref:Bifunctional DNA primase/polymerase n=1 Tax=Streptomyces hazeniae TaxID=3075538 RepID=A0ABU2NPG1_9ACTN|nr:bifunctional DNA primase/polymerase [Streptomyces sp. DSM 42041]MDT0378869.1 bifunctional DNA primase/polymerase [Streptomyces sp. DSM 42041]
MREILGRRRMTRSSLRNAALTCATRWHWPVLPGASIRLNGGHGPTAPSLAPGSPTPGSPETTPTDLTADVTTDLTAGCSCGDPECVVPGAHPLDPVLLAATTDARMVDWWWTRRPDASLLLATGAATRAGRAPCALSLPAAAGRAALAEFDRLGVRVGPVIAMPTRYALLVRPYELAELGELLYAQDRVPSSLRFHGDGGYAALPPTPAATGGVHWVRPPEAEPTAAVAEPGARPGTQPGPAPGGKPVGTAPWLPRMETLVETLVEASTETPDTGSRLAY